jgi:hypothetical protein
MFVLRQPHSAVLAELCVWLVPFAEAFMTGSRMKMVTNSATSKAFPAVVSASKITV